MSLTPAGLPAWSRTVDLSYYGGNANKQNYMSQGATNSLTDVTAEEHGRMSADQAAVTRTAPLAVIAFTPDDTSPAAPTVTEARLMSGVTTTDYLGSAAPAGFPAVARNADGDYTVTLPTSLSDEYGVSQTVSIMGAIPNTGTSAVARPAVSIVNAYTVRVYVTDATGTGVANIPVHLVIF